MHKELMPKEEIEKMLEKKEKKLSLKEQLQKDILGYDQQIVNELAKLNQIIGAKKEAVGILKNIVEREQK